MINQLREKEFRTKVEQSALKAGVRSIAVVRKFTVFDRFSGTYTFIAIFVLQLAGLDQVRLPLSPCICIQEKV